MKFIVAYDIPSSKEGDRRRNRLAKYLEGIGLRIQHSLFELDITPTSLPIITQDLLNIINEEKDHVTVYPLCNSCLQKKTVIGTSNYLVWDDVLEF